MEKVRVALVGTGAIANKHAQVYEALGFELAACCNRNREKGEAFARLWRTRHVARVEDLVALDGIDYLDVCTFPDVHIEILRLCAEARRPVLFQKPLAINREQGTAMADLARSSNLIAGVVSQHRYDDAILFLQRAFAAGRLGRILQADAYVKWYRDEAYYARPGKGSWTVEGGGALINQGIHQIDLLLHLVGPVHDVQANWQLGANHSIESEDVINALVRYRSGATGVVQASTAFWPGSAERIELHGTNGTAIVTGDQLTTWTVREDRGEPAPVHSTGNTSGASDPLAIGSLAFERQFEEFAAAAREGRQPTTSIDDGYRALDFVSGIYDACRTGRLVQLTS